MMSVVQKLTTENPPTLKLRQAGTEDTERNRSLGVWLLSTRPVCSNS